MFGGVRGSTRMWTRGLCRTRRRSRNCSSASTRRRPLLGSGTGGWFCRTGKRLCFTELRLLCTFCRHRTRTRGVEALRYRPRRIDLGWLSVGLMSLTLKTVNRSESIICCLWFMELVKLAICGSARLRKWSTSFVVFPLSWCRVTTGPRSIGVTLAGWRSFRYLGTTTCTRKSPASTRS
uniref:(northern house mosquito) hypothetical protein n=1 Tax=Culex pipiens TaxID=7175 RepID=A0A8D8DBK1_CULPI